MIEVLAFPLVLVAAALWPKMKQNDKKMIQKVFDNLGYYFGSKDDVQKPKLKGTEPIMDEDTEIGTTYLYSLPPGLKVDYVTDASIANAIGKPVEVEYKRGKGLMVHVFNEDLPELIPYKDKDGNVLVPEPEKEKDGPRKGDYLWTVPMGRGIRGWIKHDFDKVPHAVISGTTRFGKTVLLRLVMMYLILFHPNDVEIYIIDLKGGLEFNRYRKLRQVKRVAGTPKEALEMLMYLSQEEEVRDKKTGEILIPKGILDKEMERFEREIISNITETNIKKRRFIIIDEGAQLTPNKFTADMEERIQCQFKLSRIASVFGAIGVRLIYGTQYPTAKNLNPDIKMNADLKVAFRLPAGYASQVAIDETGAEKLPSDVKGRALFKTHELKEMQVPFVTHDDAWAELQRYQDPVRVEGEREDVIPYKSKGNQTGGNSEHAGPVEVRNEGTATSDSYVRF